MPVNTQPQRKATTEAAVFFALTLGLSWFVFWGPLAVFQVPTINFITKTASSPWAVALFILGGFVPSLTAIALTWRYAGRQGLRSLFRRAFQVRIGWRWYAVILALVALVTAGQLLINRLLGNRFDMGLFAGQLGSLLPLFVLGPLSEELGWRGFAQDRLQAGLNGLSASLVIGVGWVLWHLPLFYMAGTSQRVLGIPFASFAASILAGSVVYGWLHERTAGSVWTAIFFHWMYTYSIQVVSTGVTRSPAYNGLECLPMLLAAIAVVILWRPWRPGKIDFTGRRGRRQEGTRKPGDTGQPGIKRRSRMTDLDEGQKEVIEAYSRAAGGYDRVVRLFDAFAWAGFSISRWRRKAVDALHLEPGDRVLDLGCGTGLNFPLLEKAVGPQGSILGVDLSQEMLDRAAVGIQAAGWENIRLECADAAAYDIPDGLDGVLATYSLTLVSHPRQVLQKAARALAPGGRLVVLDMAWPGGCPLWFLHVLFFLRTYGVTKEILQQRPWQAVQNAIRVFLANVTLRRYWFGFFYLCSGDSTRIALPGVRPGRASKKVGKPSH